MWPEGQHIAFGRPLLRVAGAGKAMASVSEFTTAEPAPKEVHPEIDLAALEEARQEGFRRGRESALKELDAPRAFLKKCADAFQAETRRSAQRLDAAAVKMALEIAAKLLERELKDPAAVCEMVLNALKLVSLDDKLVLRVNPATAQALQKRKAETGESDLPAHVVLTVDPNVEPAGCIIQTPQENWDAQLSSRLAIVAREIERSERPE